MSFEGFPLESAIAERGRAARLDLDAVAVGALARHARAVVAANARVHLTTIVDPAEFVERHIGESLDGAALLEPAIHGTLVDLGSGNGYPGIPLAIARPGLRPALVESSAKKAAFLRTVSGALRWPESSVVERAVQRSRDLEELAPISVLATRAMGGWARVLPKIAAVVAPSGVILLWAGAEAESVLGRVAWRQFKLAERVPVAGRVRSWIWVLARV